MWFQGKAQGWEPGIPDGFSCLSHQGPVPSRPGVPLHPQQHFVGRHLKQAGVWKCCEAPGVRPGLDASAGTESSKSCPSSWPALLLPPPQFQCSDQPGLDPAPSELLQFHHPELREAVHALQVCDRAGSACPAHGDLSLPVFHSPPTPPGFPQDLLGFAHPWELRQQILLGAQCCFPCAQAPCCANRLLSPQVT